MAAATSRILSSFLALVTLLGAGYALPAVALAAEIPVAGGMVALHARAKTGTGTSLRIGLTDPAIGTPLPDPRTGATLRVHGSGETGACSARIRLEPSAWEERRGNGARWGYRYRAPRPGTQGVRSVDLLPGRIKIHGSVGELPCDPSADAPREPLSIEFQAADQRYCAEFGGRVVKNEVGHFMAVKSTAPAACRPPSMNIVLILADDLGYSDLGVQGSETIPTPHIDGLAAVGLRFTSAYASAATCAPTRAALLSGRYQQRFGFEFNTGAAIAHEEERGLDPTVTTIADVLRDAGYATGMVGKWHLGTRERFHPIERGFDEFFGFLPGKHEYFPDTVTGREVWETINRDKERANETEYLTDAFAREAVSFIERHATTPFFLYVPFNAVHRPLEAPEVYLQRFAHVSNAGLRRYYAMVSAMDDAVGAIVQAIGDQDLAHETLVVFTNDNGGESGRIADNRPLRLGKATFFEGGIRVPMIIRWPGVTTAGQKHFDPVSHLDLFPTFLAAARVAPPQGIELDGADLSPFIRGDETGPTHEYLFWRKGVNRAVRRYDWKLVQSCPSSSPVCSTWLYDLATDIGEVDNLRWDHPEIVAELLTALDEWESELATPSWPGLTGVGTVFVDFWPYKLEI